MLVRGVTGRRASAHIKDMVARQKVNGDGGRKIDAMGGGGEAGIVLIKSKL